VLGTAALRDPSLVTRLVSEHGPDALAVALDLRGGRAMADGWATASKVGTESLIGTLFEAGARTFEVTAIERDGLLGGPDLELMGRISRQTTARIVAGGGVRSVDDVVCLRDAGCAGAIVGRALYELGFDLAEAVRLTS
jgi:phosphoribosylformimino-5-aminoimidazole carboxamide ribotide isomerase